MATLSVTRILKGLRRPRQSLRLSVQADCGEKAEMAPNHWCRRTIQGTGRGGL